MRPCSWPESPPRRGQTGGGTGWSLRHGCARAARGPPRACRGWACGCLLESVRTLRRAPQLVSRRAERALGDWLARAASGGERAPAEVEPGLGEEARRAAGGASAAYVAAGEHELVF